MWRKHTNDCLELVLKHKLADADFVARLRRNDWEIFTAVMSELRCAKFLEERFGVDSLRWHPQGRKGKTGEFELSLSNLEKPIFVEVKTIFRREPERLEERVKEKLRRYARQVTFPFGLSVHINEAGNADDFSGKRFKKFLEEQLSKMRLTKLPDYIDHKTGLHLEIEAYPIPPKPPRRCYIGIIGGEAKLVKNEDYIRHSLDKAYEQLPRGKQPCLVILCSSTEFPIDEDDMLNVLLGTLAVRIPRFSDGTVGEVETIRKLDGFPRPQRNRQLSAIALYRDRYGDERIESTLEIYHNPFALNPIDPGIFEGKGVRQLVRTGETEMGWKD